MPHRQAPPPLGPVLFLFGNKRRVTVGTSILALGQIFLAALKSVKQG